MNDTVYRQAAIAEFSCCQLTPDGGIDANYAIDFLKQLPSAQPDLNTSLYTDGFTDGYKQAQMDAQEIIRCKDCKYAWLTDEGEYYPEDMVCSYWDSDGLNENDFCSYAERRTDG